MFLIVATFFAVLGVVMGAYWTLIVVPEQRERSLLRDRLKGDITAVIARPSLLKEPESFSAISPLDRLLARFSGLSAPIKKLIDQSGLDLSVGAFVLMCVASALLAAVVLQWFFGVWAGLAAAILGAMIPVGFVRRARTKRLRKFEEQFPEAMELIARALRAGHAFAIGLKIAVDEIPEPTGPEFKLLFERQNYGAQIGDALRAFAERVPLLDARMFVTAVLTQRESGGNLSEVLDRLAAVIRERFRIRREVRVKSTHARMTATALAALPPAIAVLTALVNPSQIQVMLHDPLGTRMIAAAVGLQLVGMLIVRRIINIRY